MSAPNKEVNLLLVVLKSKISSTMSAPNKEVNLLLVVIKSHLKVYAEQGSMPLVGFHIISKSHRIIMPNKEVSLLLALVPNKVVSLLLDDQ